MMDPCNKYCYELKLINSLFTQTIDSKLLGNDRFNNNENCG